MASMVKHVEAMVGFQRAGSAVFDYGNNIRGEAQTAGYKDAFAFPGFVPAYIRPLFCEGYGPFRWIALSGDPKDIAVTDNLILELFPDKPALARWIAIARERVQFQGLPARICWLKYGERARFGAALERSGREGEGERTRRHRPRSFGQWIGRESVPRNRSDARRQRRRRRLAHLECALERRQRRRVGVGAPWRWGRHGSFDSRRTRGGGRRHRRRARQSRCAARPAIPVWESYVTSMRATRKPSTPRAATTSASRCSMLQVSRPLMSQALTADLIVTGCGVGHSRQGRHAPRVGTSLNDLAIVKDGAFAVAGRSLTSLGSRERFWPRRGLRRKRVNSMPAGRW